MNSHEIALQLTLKAMETGYIVAERHTGDKIEANNEFNRKQVSEFFKAMLDTADSCYDDVVQT